LAADAGHGSALSLFAVMNAAQVPYVVVGGPAMLLHGIDRVTGDIDLVIDLAPGTLTDLVNTLTHAGNRHTVQWSVECRRR
jgi:hypothetical protein